MNVPYFSVGSFIVNPLKIFTDAFIESHVFLLSIGQIKVYRLGKPEIRLQMNLQFSKLIWAMLLFNVSKKYD